MTDNRKHLIAGKNKGTRLPQAWCYVCNTDHEWAKPCPPKSGLVWDRRWEKWVRV